MGSVKKKIIITSATVILSIVCFFLFSGKQPVLLKREGEIKNISVSSLPEGFNYSFAGEDAEKIAEYLSDIELISDFSENPEEYLGMVWVVSINYENGDVVTIYHNANKFIKTDSGRWYKMNYYEANRFEYLLDELIEK